MEPIITWIPGLLHPNHTTVQYSMILPNGLAAVFNQTSRWKVVSPLSDVKNFVKI